MQASRGSKLDPGVTLKLGTDKSMGTDSIHEGRRPGVMLIKGKEGHMETDSIKETYKIPTEADFIMAYSTKEGT